MSSWKDFNDAKRPSFAPIPRGTIAKVQLAIRPGGHDDQEHGWAGGYATRNPNSGSVYLDCDYTLLEGPYARRKVFDRIGLMSQKGPAWGEMGRSLVRDILNSARGISAKDSSPEAQAKRRIQSFADLDGIVFLARIDIGKDTNGEDKNEIRVAVTPDHKDYAAYMGFEKQPASRLTTDPGHGTGIPPDWDL